MKSLIAWMSAPILWALLSAWLHATWNALAKSVRAARAATLLTLTLALPLAWPLTWTGNAIGGGTPWPTWSTWRYLCMAAGGEVVYIVALGVAMERGDLGVTYAVSRATAMMLVWPASWLFFGSRPTAAAAVASALVLTGIALARPKAPASGSTQPRTFAALPTLVSGLGVAVYHTGYKGAVATGYPAAATFAVALSLAVPVLWMLLGRQVGPEAITVLRKFPGRMALAGAGATGSFLLALAALRTENSGVVLGVRNSSVGIALVYALLFGERPTPRQWVGLGLLLASVPLFAR
jgi:drug/metabolite transporter (DMT)-like permease